MSIYPLHPDLRPSPPPPPPPPPPLQDSVSVKQSPSFPGTPDKLLTPTTGSSLQEGSLVGGPTDRFAFAPELPFVGGERGKGRPLADCLMSNGHLRNPGPPSDGSEHASRVTVKREPVNSELAGADPSCLQSALLAPMTDTDWPASGSKTSPASSNGHTSVPSHSTTNGGLARSNSSSAPEPKRPRLLPIGDSLSKSTLLRRHSSSSCPPADPEDAELTKKLSIFIKGITPPINPIGEGDGGRFCAFSPSGTALNKSASANPSSTAGVAGSQTPLAATPSGGGHVPGSVSIPSSLSQRPSGPVGLPGTVSGTGSPFVKEFEHFGSVVHKCSPDTDRAMTGFPPMSSSALLSPMHQVGTFGAVASCHTHPSSHAHLHSQAHASPPPYYPAVTQPHPSAQPAMEHFYPTTANRGFAPSFVQRHTSLPPDPYCHTLAPQAEMSFGGQPAVSYTPPASYAPAVSYSGGVLPSSLPPHHHPVKFSRVQHLPSAHTAMSALESTAFHAPISSHMHTYSDGMVTAHAHPITPTNANPPRTPTTPLEHYTFPLPHPANAAMSPTHPPPYSNAVPSTGYQFGQKNVHIHSHAHPGALSSPTVTVAPNMVPNGWAHPPQSSLQEALLSQVNSHLEVITGQRRRPMTQEPPSAHSFSPAQAPHGMAYMPGALHQPQQQHLTQGVSNPFPVVQDSFAVASHHTISYTGHHGAAFQPM